MAFHKIENLQVIEIYKTQLLKNENIYKNTKAPMDFQGFSFWTFGLS